MVSWSWVLCLFNLCEGRDFDLRVCLGLLYDNRFAWISRWNTDWKIVEMRAYLDSYLIYQALAQNELGQYNYTMERTALVPGPVGVGCSTV